MSAIIHLAPDAPLWLKVVADTALAAHIGGGLVGIGSGAVALAAPKGSPVHRNAGNVFFVSMLTMSGVATITAPIMHSLTNTIAGIFTFYLVATAWVTVRRPEGRIGRFERFAVAAPALTGIFMLSLGLMVLTVGRSALPDVPIEAPFIMGGVATLATVADTNVILRKGLTGSRRIARHIWRMCVALFIGTGSLFLGQQQIFPHALHGSLLLWILGLAPLPVMAFWLIRNSLAGRTPLTKAIA